MLTREDMCPLPGSDPAPAHLSHAFRAIPRADATRTKPIGDAELARIYRILRDRRAERRGRA